MALQSTDLMLVYDVTASALKKCQVGDAADDIDSNDLLLVERSNVKKKMTYSDWVSSAQDTDLLLVERGGVKKKVTKANYDALLHAATDIYTANTSVTWTPVYDDSNGGAGSGSEYTGAWKVLSVTVNVTSSGSSKTGHLYIGNKVAAGTAFYSDFHMAAIQILQSNGSSFRGDGTYSSYDWNFGRNSNGTGLDPSDDIFGARDWVTTTSTNSSTSADPDTYSYTSVVEDDGSSNRRQWIYGPEDASSSAADGTASTRVGADGGIYSPTDFSGAGGSVLPAGGTVSQTGSTIQYMFCETSSTTSGSIIFLKTPQITVHNGDIIRICYNGHNGPNSTSGHSGTDTLFLRFL
tara:strand:+ start:87 stop:1136 length:1050 start_codon:yes stop_codon:yes gene_type:complete